MASEPRSHRTSSAASSIPVSPIPAKIPIQCSLLSTPPSEFPPPPDHPYPLCGSEFLRHLRAHGKVTSTSHADPATASRSLTPVTPPSTSSPQSIYSITSVDPKPGSPIPEEWKAKDDSAETFVPTRSQDPYHTVSSPSSSGESPPVPETGRNLRSVPNRSASLSDPFFPSSNGLEPGFPPPATFLRPRSSHGSPKNFDFIPLRRTSTPTLLRRPILPHEPCGTWADDALKSPLDISTIDEQWPTVFAEDGDELAQSTRTVDCDRTAARPSPRHPKERAQSMSQGTKRGIAGTFVNHASNTASRWHEFALAYSQGSFDPLHTPLFPGSPQSHSTLPMKESHFPHLAVASAERHPSIPRPTSAPLSPTTTIRSLEEPTRPHVDRLSFIASPVPVRSNPPVSGRDFSMYPNIHHPDDLRQFYESHGFLAAPLPPNESERLKALYSFNLQTGNDFNFDRIVHMTKLVFNSRMAFLSLLDGESYWYKSYAGLGYSVDETRRSIGLCAHVVLLNSDEPLVILDTAKDWRFRNSPLVKGKPHMRFYAGAPLRTSDGYNLGTLAVADDRPRSSFSPRSRLILKEFAAIVMRELELWRDRLQLRMRDRVQKSMEDFTRECLEVKDENLCGTGKKDTHLTHVYQRAADLIMTTLDLDGCTILDISSFERIELPTPDDTPCVAYQANPYSPQYSKGPSSSTFSSNSAAGQFGSSTTFPVLATTCTGIKPQSLDALDYEPVSQFFSEHRDGRIFNVSPSWLRWVFPKSIKYAMVVPIMGIDQQPFALICAHTHDKGKQFLEGFELQFVRSIGSVILSSVLRRKTMLADRSKNVIISSVSHELRTPLHGMLAAGELLSDTPLDTCQEAFLTTLRTCGLQLIETVNHVLDFAKLSIEGKDHSQIQFRRVDLGELIHSTLEGCWLGQRARHMQMMDYDSDFGCFYSPEHKGLLPAEQRVDIHQHLSNVESIADIGFRKKGWNVICETGGLRRIIMNLYNNSLKYTKEGYVQIVLRELPHPPSQKRIPVEIRVIDTGKGIGKEFLENQMFQPFAQENPLQPGTGLGLAIVANIVTSEAMRGSLDVYSAENVGTEIRIQFEVETVDEDENGDPIPPIDSTFGKGYKVAFINYTPSHRGLRLQSEVMGNYAKCLGFGVAENLCDADIIIVNEAVGVTQEIRDTCRGRPMILIVSFKIHDMATLDAMGRTNAYTGILYKPVGSGPFVRALEAAVEWTNDPQNPERLGALAQLRKAEEHRESVKSGHDTTFAGVKDGSRLLLAHRPRTPVAPMTSPISSPTSSSSRHRSRPSLIIDQSPLESPTTCVPPRSAGGRMRPLPSRAFSAPLTPGCLLPPTPTTPLTSIASPDIPRPTSSAASSVGSSVTAFSTVSIAEGGVMLASCQPLASQSALRYSRAPRIMVVEDNPINRRVLAALLKKRQFDYTEAVNGAVGVELFKNSPPNYWDAILMDITMPVMDGLEATRAIRRIETARRVHSAQAAGTPDLTQPQPCQLGPPFEPPSPSHAVFSPTQPQTDHHTLIFALTGLATVDDKRKAFASGVDGYLVKPVSLGTLDLLFKNIGF